MDNVKVTVEGAELVIRCRLDAAATPSASGKTLVIASTRGSVKVPGTDAMLGLNLYRYPGGGR